MTYLESVHAGLEVGDIDPLTVNVRHVVVRAPNRDTCTHTDTIILYPFYKLYMLRDKLILFFDNPDFR